MEIILCCWMAAVGRVVNKTEYMVRISRANCAICNSRAAKELFVSQKINAAHTVEASKARQRASPFEEFELAGQKRFSSCGEAESRSQSYMWAIHN